MANLWQTFGQLLANCLQAFSNIWQTFGQHLAIFWQTFGQISANIRGVLANFWPTFGVFRGLFTAYSGLFGLIHGYYDETELLLGLFGLIHGFYFLIRILPAKWRWSQAQRHIWQVFFKFRPGVVVASATLRTPKAVPHLKVGQKCQNRHETGRELTKININQSKLCEISMRIQP